MKVAGVGVGFKPVHLEGLLAYARRRDRRVHWLEVHPENYMGAGGAPHRALAQVRECYGLSLHGVGMSLGGGAPLDEERLQVIADLVRRYEPALVSEHLAWSTWESWYLNDLLPVPLSEEALEVVAERVNRVQEVLGRKLLLENPSIYGKIELSTIPEPEFLGEVARRTGCGLLVDVNNVVVSGWNTGFSPSAYVDAVPVEHVGEIHVAGHAQEVVAGGEVLKLDDHGSAVRREVWELLVRLVGRLQRDVPLLVEWDARVPAVEVLLEEGHRAHALAARAV